MQVEASPQTGLRRRQGEEEPGQLKPYMPRYWGYGQSRSDEIGRGGEGHIMGPSRPLLALGTLEYPAAVLWCDVCLSEVLGKE